MGYDFEELQLGKTLTLMNTDLEEFRIWRISTLKISTLKISTLKEFDVKDLQLRRALTENSDCKQVCTYLHDYMFHSETRFAFKSRAMGMSSWIRFSAYFKCAARNWTISVDITFYISDASVGESFGPEEPKRKRINPLQHFKLILKYFTGLMVKQVRARLESWQSWGTLRTFSNKNKSFPGDALFPYSAFLVILFPLFFDFSFSWKNHSGKIREQ